MKGFAVSTDVAANPSKVLPVFDEFSSLGERGFAHRSARLFQPLMPCGSNATSPLSTLVARILRWMSKNGSISIVAWRDESERATDYRFASTGPPRSITFDDASTDL